MINIKETYLYDQLNNNDFDDDDKLNEFDAEKASEVMTNKPKMKKKKKKKTKKSCKNKNNNNNNNNNGNNNGYIIKIEEESSIERQTHENSELKEEIDNHSEIKTSNDQSYNSQKFPQIYEEYLDNNKTLNEETFSYDFKINKILTRENYLSILDQFVKKNKSNIIVINNLP